MKSKVLFCVVRYANRYSRWIRKQRKYAKLCIYILINWFTINKQKYTMYVEGYRFLGLGIVFSTYMTYDQSNMKMKAQLFAGCSNAVFLRMKRSCKRGILSGDPSHSTARFSSLRPSWVKFHFKWRSRTSPKIHRIICKRSCVFADKSNPCPF